MVSRIKDVREAWGRGAIRLRLVEEQCFQFVVNDLCKEKKVNLVSS